MISCSANFKSEFLTFGRQLKASVTIGSTTYTEDYVSSVIPEFEGELLTAVMRSLTIEIIGVTSVADEASVSATISVLHGSSWETLTLSTYTVYEQEYDDGADILTVKCYDGMLKAMKDFSVSVTYPTTVKGLLQAICTACGYTLGTTTFANSSHAVASNPYDGLGYTYRDVITEIAQAAGRTAVVTGTSLKLLAPTASNFTITASDLRSIVIGEHFGPVNSVVLSRQPQEDNVYQQDSTSISANGLHEIKIANNLLMDGDRAGYLPALFTAVSGMEFDTAEISHFGLPWLDVCDLYTCTDLDGTNHTLIALQNSCSIGKGCTGSMQTVMPEMSKTDYKKAASSTEKSVRITELYVDKVAGEIVSLASDVQELDGEYTTLSSQVTQTAEAITAEVTRATGAESSLSSSISQTAEAITAEVTRATGAESALSSSISQTAEAISSEVTRATAAEGALSTRITQTADGIELVAQKVDNIGGRNLIQGTLNPVVTPVDSRPKIVGQTTFTTGQTNATWSAADITPEGVKYGHGFRVTNTDARRPFVRFGTATVSAGSLNGLVAGWTYTMSGRCQFRQMSNYSGSDTYAMRVSLYTDAENPGSSFAVSSYFDIYSITPSLAGAIRAKRFAFTFTVPSAATMAYIVIRCTNTTDSAYGTSDYIDLRDLKLERGEVATGWTPAPEDQVGNDEIIAKINLTSEAALIQASRIDLQGSVSISSLTAAAQAALVTGTTVKNQYYLSTSSSSATGGSWSDTEPTWSSGKYVWTRVATTKTFADGTSSTTNSTAVYDANLTSALSTASSAQTTAGGAVAETVSVYYRSSTSTTPTIDTSMSIGTSATRDDEWEYVMPRPKNGRYFFTCERYTKQDGTVSFSTVRQMANLTYTSLWCSAAEATCIDGASIYTGSITADKITVSDLQALGATIGGWDLTATMISNSSAVTSGTASTQYQAFMQSSSGASGLSAFAVRKRAYDGSAYDDWDYQFQVTYGGKLLAKNAEITGKITASSGEIGGWTINSTSITKDTTIDNENYHAFVSAPASPTSSNRAFGVRQGSSTYPFQVTYDGSLVATKATITGSITATAGKIGRYDITSTYLRAWGTEGDNSTCVGIGATAAFWAGSSSSNSAPFRVTYAGALTATNATITGSITATSGSIDGSLVTSGISASNITTGTLAAARIAAGSIKATKIDLDDLFSQTVTATNLTLSGGSVDISTTSQSTSKIKLSGNGSSTSIAAEGITITHGSNNIRIGDMSSYGYIQMPGFQVTSSGIVNGTNQYGNVADTGMTGSNSASSVSVGNGSSVNLTSVSLTKGKWVVAGWASFPSNTTGIRRVAVTSTSANSLTGFIQSTPPCTGSIATHVNVAGVFTFTGTSTVYLVGYQNSGGALTVAKAEIYAVKIA